MHPQCACIRRCKITLNAFVCFFPTVCFQMSPQIVCPSRCVFTLVAFVWFFSTMSLQMWFQIACTRNCKTTLVAHVRLFSAVSFQVCPQVAYLKGGKTTLVSCIRRCIIALGALFWLPCICCLCQWNLNIGMTNTWTDYVPSIAREKKTCVIPCLGVVANWRKS